MTSRRLATRFFFYLIMFAFTVTVIPTVSPAQDDIPRMTIQELKAKMDRGENIVILDVRSGEDYATSKVRITGAIRIPLDQLKSRYKELPTEREIIAYCA